MATGCSCRTIDEKNIAAALLGTIKSSHLLISGYNRRLLKN
jgi:hypothetical protein